MRWRNLIFRSDNKEDFWGEYKLLHPEEAKAIETITGDDFSLLSNKDAKEKVSSLQRLARNNNCSIVEVKDVFLNSFIEQFGIDSDTIRDSVEIIVAKIEQESLRYNIDRENTSSFYISNWLMDLMRF